jgi:hypothetical protein
MLNSTDVDGLTEGTGAITISNITGGGMPVDFAAYQMNLMLWRANCDSGKKKHLLNFGLGGGGDCDDKEGGVAGYRFIPVYFLLHKSLVTQLDKSTLTNDLLNNEHGGLINIKFTPSLLEFSGLDVTGKKARDPNSMFTSIGFDMGVKGIEAPSASDPKAVSLIGAGYLGLGVTTEFALFNAVVDTRYIAEGAKPDGHLAVGLGVYKNRIENGNIDPTLFSTAFPKSFATYVFNYELQVNKLISLVGSRSIPTTSNSLGSYTSIALRFQPSK